MSKLIYIIFFLILAGIVAGVTLAKGGSGNNDSQNELGENYNSKRIENTNKFTSTISGTVSGYLLNVNIEEEIRRGSKTISDIFNDNVNLPISYIITQSGKPSVIAAASKHNSSRTSGGVVYLYTDFNGTLSCPYSEVIAHELLHILGIGLDSKWVSAVDSNNKTLNGSMFLNTLTYYKELKGEGSDSITKIPLGDVNGHWQEEEFSDEIMTPSIQGESDLKLSKLTGHALKDIGWDINFSNFENYSL